MIIPAGIKILARGKVYGPGHDCPSAYLKVSQKEKIEKAANSEKKTKKIVHKDYQPKDRDTGRFMTDVIREQAADKKKVDEKKPAAVNK